MKRKMTVLSVLILFTVSGCGKTMNDTDTESYIPAAFEAEVTESSGKEDSKEEEKSEKEENEAVNTEKLFNCDANKLDEGMSSAEVTEIYQSACFDGKENGYTPVIVFYDEILEDCIEGNYESEGGPEAYINAMLSVEYSNGKKLLDERYAGLESLYGEEFLAVDNDTLDIWLSVDDSSMNGGLPAANMYEGEVYLVQVPTDKPYEIFAWLPFCGWNDCPDTDEMIAVCKYWYDEYGAAPAVITHDTLEFYLSEPVTDKETAILIAGEQSVFCSDVLDMGGIAFYVAMTLDSNVWSFWWD